MTDFGLLVKELLFIHR